MEMVGEEQEEPAMVSPKRLKVEETLVGEEEEEEDRISALPDCLILQILSLLPSTKDAVRTGTLSKRWIFLWTSIPSLVFQCFHSNRRTSDFVCFIYKTLIQCRHSKLKKFEVLMEYDGRFESHVNVWILYAISRNVEKLTLALGNNYSADEFLLPEQFFINSCFTDLKIGVCILTPNGAISWKLLRRLCVSGSCLDEALIENILSGTPVLETLVLDYCYGYSRLDITSKSVKNLVFIGYDNPDDDDLADVVEINAPNLLSIKIQSSLLLWKLLLLDVSSLVKADLDYQKLGYDKTTPKETKEEVLKGFIESLRHVKELKVGVFCSKALSRLEAKGFSFPSNMKLPDVTSD